MDRNILGEMVPDFLDLPVEKQNHILGRATAPGVTDVKAFVATSVLNYQRDVYRKDKIDRRRAEEGEVASVWAYLLLLKSAEVERLRRRFPEQVRELMASGKIQSADWNYIQEALGEDPILAYRGLTAVNAYQRRFRGRKRLEALGVPTPWVKKATRIY
jgi:hypothetical protein